MSNGYKFCPRCATPLIATEIAGLRRGACGACDFVHWDNPIPVVAAVIEVDGHILLARNRKWPEGKFGLITGFLERDDVSPEAGIAREVREETALDVVATSLIGVYPYALKNEVLLAYHAVAKGTVRLNEELVEYRLIAPEKLQPWDTGTGYAVRDWLVRRNQQDSRPDRSV